MGRLPTFHSLAKISPAFLAKKVRMESPSQQQPKSDIRCMLATEADLDDLIALQYAACVDYPFHDAIWGKNTHDNRQKARRRLHQKWQDNSDLKAVKCIDNETDDVMAWCLWEAIGEKSNREEAVQEDVMTDCEWLQGEARELARAHLQPAMEKRWEIMQGRPYMVLTNLCTAPEHRKKGAAQALVRWGLNEAQQRRVPAYCEASEMGKEMYVKLGFEKVDVVESRFHGELIDECVAMVKG